MYIKDGSCDCMKCRMPVILTSFRSKLSSVSNVIVLIDPLWGEDEWGYYSYFRLLHILHSSLINQKVCCDMYQPSVITRRTRSEEYILQIYLYQFFRKLELLLCSFRVVECELVIIYIGKSIFWNCVLLSHFNVLQLFDENNKHKYMVCVFILLDK